MSAIAAVFFDLDGTLVDDAANWSRSVTATVNAVTDRHMQIDADQLEAAYYRVSTQVWQEALAAEVSPLWDMDATTISTQIWTGALAEIGVGDAEIIQRAAATYHRVRNTGLLKFDEVDQCLSTLQQKYQLGVITNGPAETQNPKLESADLMGYFESVTTVDIGYRKPQVDIFEHALNGLGASAAESVYVGDYLIWDVAGANAAGMHSVWVNRTATVRQPNEAVPDAEIVTLAELPEVVAAFEAS